MGKPTGRHLHDVMHHAYHNHNSTIYHNAWAIFKTAPLYADKLGVVIHQALDGKEVVVRACFSTLASALRRFWLLAVQ